MKQSRLAILGALAAGVILGAASMAHTARANIVEDILNFFGGKGAPASTSPVAAPAAVRQEEKPVPLYKPALEYEERVMNAVENAAPSVVSIVVSKDLPVIEQCPSNPFQNLPPEVRDFFDDGFAPQVYVPCERGTARREIGGGTGFIVSSEGLIVTNKHVVGDDKAEYTVLANDGKKYEAAIVARDPVQDIAIVKITASGLKAARLGDSDAVKLGQTAIAIGNALGEFRNTVSVGVISGLARTITASGGGVVEEIEGVLQTDAAINQGNSGGPILNLRGEVIGMSTAMAAGAQNIGFAIPVNQIKRDIESVKTTGAIKVPYLGVRAVAVAPEFAKAQKLPVEYGALLRGDTEGPAVVPGSPAAKAGLVAEDIVLEVNGETVARGRSLSKLIQKYGIGDALVLKVRRGGETLALRVRLEERPAGF